MPLVRFGLGFLLLFVLSACDWASREKVTPIDSTEAAALPGAATSSDPEPEELGDKTFGELPDEHEFKGAVSVLAPGALLDPPRPIKNLPHRVVLENLPAVQWQGKAGSCEAESFGYGIGAFTAARDLDGSVLWDASKPENEPSPAFLYSWQHRLKKEKCPTATGAVPYLSYLVSTGSPSVKDVPYKADCDYLDTIESTTKGNPDAARLRIGSFATFAIQPGSLQLMKEMIHSGHVVAFSGPVLEGYNDPQLENGVLYGTAVQEKGGHGQMVVGYDDDLGVPGKTGAFLVQNSFGSKWPKAAPGGRIWMSYGTFLHTQKFAAVAYPRNPNPPDGDALLSVAPEKGSAPRAVLERAYEWDAPRGGVLILMHYFADPVLVESIELIDPLDRTVDADLNQFIQYGYTHFRRQDGMSFLTGTWRITIHAKNTDGARFTYTGKFKLKGGPLPAPLPKVMLGPKGTAATVR